MVANVGPENIRRLEPLTQAEGGAQALFEWEGFQNTIALAAWVDRLLPPLRKRRAQVLKT